MHRDEQIRIGLIRPLVVAAVAAFIALPLVVASDPGDTWGIHLLWMIPLASAVVGLITGLASAVRMSFPGYLTAIVGLGLGLFAAQVAFDEGGSFVGLSLVLGGFPFSIGYAVTANLKAWRCGTYERGRVPPASHTPGPRIDGRH